MPVRLSSLVILVVGILLSFFMGSTMVETKGLTEVEIQWKGSNAAPTSRHQSDILISHSLSLQGEYGRLRPPTELDVKWSKDVKGSFAIQQGELILKPSDYQVRLFYDKGFRSTLDPMRLLSSSRRAQGVSGLEMKGIQGSVSGRGLWLEEIDNIGDNGPLLFLDVSLNPVGSSYRHGKYRYIYLSHDSDWNWHFPKTGAYATRTSRHIHSLMGTWNLVSNFRVSTQIATLSGLDAKKTYHRDLQGFAFLTRGEGYWHSGNWLLDVYRTNPGFVLATGDSESLAAGRQGVRGRLTRCRHRDESLGLTIRHDMPVREVLYLPLEMPGYDFQTESYSEIGLTGRRRLAKLSYRWGLDWETGKGVQNPKVVWETTWLPWSLRFGGRWGGMSNPQIYSTFPIHPLAMAEARWEPPKGWWRTAIKVQGIPSNSPGKSRWQGEAVYKKRPGKAYTYLVVQHKMEKGYWKISWGKSDQGRLDWSWNEGPQVRIGMGRYF